MSENESDNNESVDYRIPKRLPERQAKEVYGTLGTVMSRAERRALATAYSKGSSEANLFYRVASASVPKTVGYDQVAQLSRALGLPERAEETANEAFDIARKRAPQAHRARLAAYAVFVAARRHGLNVRTRDIVKASNGLGRRVRMSDIMHLQFDAPIPFERRGVKEDQERLVRELIKQAKLPSQDYGRILESAVRQARAVPEGTSPQTAAAASVYAVLPLVKGKVKRRVATQGQLAKIVGASEYSVREAAARLRKETPLEAAVEAEAKEKEHALRRLGE